MNSIQHTIKQPVTLSGIGLHTGTLTSLTLLPSPPDSGIVFKNAHSEKIPALLSHVNSTNRCTTLGTDLFQVHTVEHLLAALSGLGVDNIEILINGEEIPILDGSAKLFCDEILKAGFHPQPPPRDVLICEEAFHFTSSNGSTYLFSPSNTTSFEVVLSYPETPMLDRLKFTYSEMDDFSTQVAPARTYCLDYEVELLRNSGLIRGGSLEHALVISRESNPEEWRFENEPARHKLLDLMGDLTLLGKPFKGHLLAIKPGHHANVEFGNHFLQILAKLEQTVS